MLGHCFRLVAAAAVCIALAGCASGPDSADLADSGTDAPARPQQPAGPVLQCVPYARDHSTVKLRGDAYTWWDQAAGRFARAAIPSEGAVMVLYNYAGPNRGHVAVVREILDARTIKVDHANWLDDGVIFTDDPVRDVSPGNDWSLVRVFNKRTGAWGTRVYPVQGFIGPGPDSGDDPGDLKLAQGGAQPRDPIAALLSHDDPQDDSDSY